jgi:hypothetical protein
MSGQVDGTGAAAGGEEDAAGGPSGTVQETAGVAPGETTGAGVGATGPGVVPSGDKLAEDTGPAVLTPEERPGVVPPEGAGAPRAEPAEGSGVIADEGVTAGTAGAYSGAATPGGATEIVPATTNKPVADELDVGSLIWNSPPARRAAAIALGLLVLLMMLLRRRRGGSGL